MNCGRTELLSILPEWLKQEVSSHAYTDVQEIRLRIHQFPELITRKRNLIINRLITKEDLEFIINVSSQYSPWVASTISAGFLTAPGGHRIGICGEAVVKDGKMTSVRQIRSLCIRVAKDVTGIADGLEGCKGSVLIIGKPGNGKTTLLRDLIRIRSRTETVAVVDERLELFPASYDTGYRTDILSGCPKGIGIDIVLRTMGPSTIAVDEITAASDCKALIQAGWCGVALLATAHAATKQDLFSRLIYRPLLQMNLFQYLVILQEDKSWILERMDT